MTLFYCKFNMIEVDVLATQRAVSQCTHKLLLIQGHWKKRFLFHSLTKDQVKYNASVQKDLKLNYRYGALQWRLWPFFVAKQHFTFSSDDNRSQSFPMACGWLGWRAPPGCSLRASGSPVRLPKTLLSRRDVPSDDSQWECCTLH